MSSAALLATVLFGTYIVVRITCENSRGMLYGRSPMIKMSAFFNHDFRFIAVLLE